MIVLDFGNCCFNGSREEYIMIVVAPKTDFASKDAFLDGAIRFLNADENSDFFDDYEELYQERSYEPVNIDIDADFKNMNQRVGFLMFLLTSSRRWPDRRYTAQGCRSGRNT